MENKEIDKIQQIEDIINLGDNALDIEEIELIATNVDSCKEYEKDYKGELYTVILRSLTHETFSEKDAKILWNEIIGHMGELNKVLGRNVGVAVASLDYLSNIKKTLSEPKIIEEDKSRFVSDATAKDELTGLFLREIFDVVLKKETEKAKRGGSPLCLIMIDIDDFKNINDTYGHLEGDKVLKRIGSVLNDSSREMDWVARYGGEELAIIMPKANMAKACNAAQRIRKTIEGIQFSDFSVTVSIGVSQSTASLNTPEKIIKSADEALYAAKNNGKNQVVMSTNDEKDQHG